MKYWPLNPNIMLDDVDFFKNFCVFYQRENGLPQIRVTDLRTGNAKPIPFPEPAYTAYPYANRVYDTTEFRYGYQSPITPAVSLRLRHGEGNFHVLEAERSSRRI